MTATDDITVLLARWQEGDAGALDVLVPLVHQELHRLAGIHMSAERRGHVLQTTALVNEAYLRLRRADGTRWQNRMHFFAIASRAMRRILVDLARAQHRRKRDAGRRVDLEEALVISSDRTADIIALDEALTTLASLSPRQSQVVELRFFGGLTEPEIGEALQVSTRTVSGEWRLARSWLLRELSRENAHDA